LTPQLHESAGGLPSLKLSLHSCSLPGSTNAMGIETSIALVLPAREHECNGSLNMGRPLALSSRVSIRVAEKRLTVFLIISELPPVPVMISVSMTVVPVEKKKTTTVKLSPVTVNRDVSAGSNAGIKKKEIKTVNNAEATPKTGPAKKLIPKATLTDSRSQKATISRAESLKATKSRSAKKVAPLKDQNRMQKSEPKQTSSDKVQTQALQDGEAESEVNIESINFDFIYPSLELKDPPACNESEPFSCNDIGEEESLITYTVNGRSDEELPENSTIMPTVIESSHASSDKEVSEVSLIALPVVEVQKGNENNDSKNGRKSVVLKHRQGEQEKKDAHGLLNNIIEETASKLAESRKSKVKALVGAFETVISLSKMANPLPRNEESSIAPLVVESSHASSDKEESLIAPPVSESTQDEGVLEDESEYTDDHNEEVEVSEDESESSDNEKEVAAAQNDEMDTPSEETPRVKSAIPNYLRASTGSCHDICKYGKRHEHVSEETPRVKSAILPSMELVNPPVCNESEPFSWDDIGEEESFITYTVNERSELIPDEELLEESSIAPLVVESSHASSDKEESLIAPPVSESTQDEGVLEDESEYTDDHNEEVEVSEDESKSSDKEKEVSAAQNDEMDTPSEETPRVKSVVPNYLRASTGSFHDICKYGKRHEHVSEETPRVKSAILPSMELINPSVCNEFEPFSWYDIGKEESFISYTVNERSELIPDEELPENSTIMPTV
ncbi:ribonuclease H-like domain-containing protein, partial [Tanacetum coccineum]